MNTNWSMKRFDEVATVVTGSTPSTKKNEYYGGDTPFVTPAELNSFKPIMNSKQTLTKIGADEARIIPKDSVCVCCIGSLGKTGIAGKELVTNQQINSLIFDKQKVYPLFGYYYCTTIKPILENMAPATTIAIVNKSRFSSLSIPLPPLDVQKKIATVLEEADKLREDSKKVDEELNQWVPSVFLDMFGDPKENRNNWIVKELKDISDIVSGVTKGQKFNDKPTKIVPYIRVANVQDGYMDLSEIKTIEAKVTDIEKYILKSGDVLLTEGGDFDKLGRGAIWKGQVKKCIHQNHIFRVRTDKTIILPEFFASFLSTNSAKAYFLKCAKQTTNLASINMTQLKKLPVMIPPITLQEKYVGFLEDKEKLQAEKGKASESVNNLFNSLLQRAFKGELEFNDKAF